MPIPFPFPHFVTHVTDQFDVSVHDKVKFFTDQLDLSVRDKMNILRLNLMA